MSRFSGNPWLRLEGEMGDGKSSGESAPHGESCGEQRPVGVFCPVHWQSLHVHSYFFDSCLLRCFHCKIIIRLNNHNGI